jgi:two-component system sensor kinase FixL
MLKSALDGRWTASAPFRYGLAVLSVAVALALTYLLQPHVFRTPLFFLAIMLVTWLCGTGPGLLTVLLSTLSISFILIPQGAVATRFHYVPNLIAFVVSAMLVGSWSAARRRAEEGLRRARGELEAKVQEQTADLRRSNEQLQKEITERERAEAVLRDSEEQWKAVFENNPTMYFMVDVDGITRSVNTFGAEQLGYTPDELVGSPVLDIFYEADREAVRGNVARCFDQLNQSMSWESRKVRKDGHVLWVRETARAVLLKNSPVILVACEDITERKRAEEAAQRSESELRDLIENIPAMVFIALPGPSNAFASRRWRAYTGLSEDNTTGSGWNRVVHPEDMDRHLEKWRVCSATGQTFEDEARFRRAADGEYRWFLVRAVPLRAEAGSILKWYGVLTDIEDRKRAEEALREQASLLDLTHDTIFVRGMDDVITYWNRGAEELYGWASEEAVGQITHRLTQTIFPAPLEEINQELLRTGRWEGELIHTKRDGSRVVVASRWALQRDEPGKAIAILETNNDITERRRAEEALQKAQAELAHITRVTAMGELTSSIAHEVNQPLAAIVTNANAALRWLAGNPPNLEEARESVGRITRDGHRASDVVGRVRALFKKAATARERLDVNDLIQDVLALVPGEVRRNRILVRTELAPDLTPVVGDRIQLQQVLLNLIINGIEAMNAVTDRPRKLIIRSQRHDHEGVLVSVEDSGVGFEAGNSAQIFDAFFTTKPKGLGMGLSISRTTIEAHGGRLWATSNDRGGATFQFNLPTNEGSV